MKGSKLYPKAEDENSNDLTLHEPAVALEEPNVQMMPDDVDYAHIVNGVLQVTPDIEEEIAEIERGETVSMSEFRNMFAQWL